MDKKTYSKFLGQYLKQIRIEKGMSQSDLSDLLGNNFQNISAIERGEFTITIYTAQKFADAFEISLSALFKGFEDYSFKKEE